VTTLTAVRTPADFRAEFPILGRVVHLASCSLGARAAALDAPALAAWLGEHGIAVSARGSVTRFSFHYFNNEQDVEQLCAALRQFRSLKEKGLGYR
jgi:hypothetical protein